MKKLVLLVLILCTNILKGEDTLNNKLNFVWLEERTKIVLNFDDNITVTKAESYAIYDHRGGLVKVKMILPKGKKVTLYTEKLDLSQNYYVMEGNKKIFAYPSRHLLNKYFYYKGKLGPSFNRKGIFTLRIWSPTATALTFKLFNKKNKNALVLKTPMLRKKKGIWEVTLDPKKVPNKEILGHFYQLEVTAFGKTVKAYDPYSKSAAAFNSRRDKTLKSAIVDLSSTTPRMFKKSQRSNRELLKNGSMSFIGYEAHVRDLTMDKSLQMPEEDRGTYSGVKAIIPKLKDLGITHLQLLPIQNFLSVNEYDRSFQPASLNKDHINYNWGYDPQHYFSPEGWFSKKPTDPHARIKELKEMVMNLHLSGVGVIMDVVYNHLNDGIQFEAIAPGCYLRRKGNGIPSDKSGAGYTFDSKIYMARRMIIDSLEFFQREYHINGFRFDLMSFIDIDTMVAIRERLGSDVILYGEAWEFTDLPLSEAPTKSQLPTKAIVGAFNDVTRDSFISGDEGPGFILGESALLPKVHSGIVGSIKNFPSEGVVMSEDTFHNHASAPYNTINYLSIHDGATLWDKINRDMRGSISERKARLKQGYAMLLTSQGKVVLHAGDEIGRSKLGTPKDPDHARPFTGKNEKGPFHANSYRSSDFTNQINWSNEKNFKGVKNYVKGLIELRKSERSLRYDSATKIRKGLKFLGEHAPPKSNMRHTGINNFSEASEITLKFIGGPKNKSYYFAGEIWSGNNKNPAQNEYKVEFDDEGKGEITFNREQISRFSLKDWSSPSSLEFKLVNRPGEWKSVPGAYTGTGNNSLRPSAVDKNTLTALFNLKVVNHIAGEVDFTYNQFVAYSLDTKLEGKSKYKKLIVIHNAGKDQLLIVADVSAKNTDILVDGISAGVTPIEQTEVIIRPGKILVPAHSSAVIGVH
ncbi:MAG: hypothetical protein KAG61_08160 [Bacteriovoracaceae bacterium]|nr:hypothetical protein [Bacteriovoracaceae bacterium]